MSAEKRAEERGDEREPFDSEAVASYRDCTGLMPALPRDRAEDESLAALYRIRGENPRRREDKSSK